MTVACYLVQEGVVSKSEGRVLGSGKICLRSWAHITFSLSIGSRRFGTGSSLGTQSPYRAGAKFLQATGIHASLGSKAPAFSIAPLLVATTRMI